MWNCLVFLQVIDKSFGFDTAVEEAQRAINAAHVEAESIENGIGVVKLMGRYSGMITLHLFVMFQAYNSDYLSPGWFPNRLSQTCVFWSCFL